jgi:Tfp pilus assembly protein PilN
MIKINLSTSRKQTDLTNLGGIDLTKIKIKALVLALIIMYVPDFALYPTWEAEIEQANKSIEEKRDELNKLKRKVSQSQALEKQIKELRAQEENLGKKLTAVKQAISEKRNPSSLLLYIAQNIPGELWVQELTIDGENMTIKGEALSYQSVGNFVTSLRSSVFIKDASIVGTSSKVRDSDRRRVESFEVKFAIARFDQ